MKSTNVTVFIEVYNEESRIESCLRSFSWADEIIVFDKYSTDRTREIALRFATEVILVPFCTASENVINNIESRESKEWCLFPTASSLMHPDLADEIINITSNPEFEFDVIGLPYGMYSFGIRNSHSPYFRPYKYTLIRRSKIRISTKLHNEISFNSNRIYNINYISDDAVLYHCTHENAELFWERVIRYSKYETIHDTQLTKKRAFYDILKALIHVTLRRRTFLLGSDGVALSLAYISYFIVRFIYIWDRERPNRDSVYPQIRDFIDNLWKSKVV